MTNEVRAARDAIADMLEEGLMTVDDLKMAFMGSYAASERSTGKLSTRVVTVYADGCDEAYGKIYKAIKEKFPTSSWAGHEVNVDPTPIFIFETKGVAFAANV